MADIPDYIARYGERVGLPHLKFNSKNVCSLTFDSKIDVDIIYEKEKDQCIIASPVIDLPSERQDELLKKIMTENDFGLATAGCFFGIETVEGRERIVMSYTFVPSSRLTFEAFKNVIGNFVDTVEEWQKKCKSWVSGSKEEKPKEESKEEKPSDDLEVHSMYDKIRCCICRRERDLVNEDGKRKCKHCGHVHDCAKEGHCYEADEWPWWVCPYCDDRFSEK